MAEAVSFMSFVHAQGEWMMRNLPRDSAEYVVDIYKKTKQKRLARRLGVTTAEEFLSDTTLDETFEFIEQENLDRFVVKPLSSRSSCGCRAIMRDGGLYLDLASGRRSSLAQLKREVRREYSKLRRPDRWLVEELLSPGEDSRLPIDDVKLYCFGGTVELILQKSTAFPGGNNKGGVQWFTREWEPVNVGKYADRVDDRIQPPECREQLVQVAERLSKRLCYPFIRIDLYPSSRGVVFGEFTPGPGRADQFDEDWNRRLCARWIDAAVRVSVGLRDGTLVPLSPE